VEGEVSITLTGNEEIREMNAAYRGKDVPTDVLSFPMDPDWDESYVLLGDVVISLERAEEQAKDYGHSLNREVGFLTVHGMLHLMGYDHETPEEASVMEACQEEILAEMELPR
jgi:probable rRNA maturation factor